VALLSRWDTADIEQGAPVVMLELAPVAAAPPAPSTELPPGLQQTEAEAQAQMRQEPETRQPVEPHEKDEIPIEHPEVSLPPPTHDPTRESAEAKLEQQATEPTPAATAPPSVEMLASRPEGPPMGEVSKTPSAAEITWQRSMLSRVQRFHRYPARAHNESGVAQVEIRHRPSWTRAFEPHHQEFRACGLGPGCAGVDPSGVAVSLPATKRLGRATHGDHTGAIRRRPLMQR
jgi:hypothetical protein